MDEEFAFLLFWFGVSMTTNIGLLYAWFRANKRLKRAEDLLFTSPQPQHEDRRSEDIERQLDNLNAQMDQLANGQEFLNRVMAERLERIPKVVEAPKREITPH
jgi:hypothetical protein